MNTGKGEIYTKEWEEKIQLKNERKGKGNTKGMGREMESTRCTEND